MKSHTQSALLLIDFQKGFYAPVWGARNNDCAEENARRLLAAWREAGRPVCHVRHLSRDPESALQGAGTEWIDGLSPEPGEGIFEKSVNSAFIGTDLEQHLRTLGVPHVVIAGLTTPHCVSTTSRMAANLGFGVTLAHDACAAFETSADFGWLGAAQTANAQAIHVMAVAQLHGEFVTARSISEILGE